MIEAFQQFILKKNLCNPTDKILVAVSGGVDSVVLLDLFVRSGYSVAVAHCNFKLRGSESDDDELFVELLANKYQLGFYTKSFDTEKFATDNKCSIQETARALRYNWFDELCKKHNFDWVAVGQHLDDQMETFFINLFRGAGVTGLKGMPVNRDDIIRPMLFTRRNEIEKYAKQFRLQFREDSSNHSDKYLRNQIRYKILPEIKKVKEGAEDAFIKSLENLYEDDLMLNQLIDEKRSKLFRQTENGWEINMIKLKEHQPLNTWLFYLLKDFGFSRDHTNQIAKSLNKEHSGKIFNSPSHQLLIDRENILIKEKNQEVDKVYLINENDEESEAPVKLKLSKQPFNTSINLKKDSSLAYFDFDKLTFPLKIRKWRRGDRFVPFGMTGSKLVSDYLIDVKLSRFEKEKIFVITSAEKIIWLIGHRSSDYFKITPETKQIFSIRLD